MRADAEGYVARIDAALNLVKMSLDWDRALRRLDELNAKVEDPTLWDNPKAAEEVMRERRRLDAAIGTVREIDADKAGTVELIELAEIEGDAELGDEGAASLKALADRADRDKVAALLSGEADSNDTFIEIHAGAGGTESQDWAEMLQRMYYRWAEQRGYKVEMVDYQAGDQAGIKSATLLVKGENAYGYAKTESGVHRLVRISPYDSAAKRHTSFSSVWVYPVIDDNIDIEINEGDLKIDTYRASGAGGQHVNTTDSAVRITHKPSGIVVARMTAASTRTAQLLWACLRRDCMKPNCANVKKLRAANMRQRPKSAGVTRSVPTCFSHIRWSKTCVQASHPPRLATFLMAI